MQRNKLDRADFWLERGFYVLPCQPNQKALVSGFGQYRAKITSHVEAVQFWGIGGSCNMAVLAPEGFYILDFDIPEVYKIWSEACPDGARSYTETTPRGGRHVFLRGTPPAGLTLIHGAEIKRVVLVDPSSVDGKPYYVTRDGGIVRYDETEILTPISKPGHATPYALHASEIRLARSGNPLSRVDQIKSHFLISHVIGTFKPNIEIKNGNNGFQACECPLEKHHSKAPFFFNDAQGFWKCHACGIGGDVINLYARFACVNLRDAISRMWSEMAVRS